MRKLLYALLTILPSIGLSQEKIAPRDTSLLPRLEIPEITIVGKRAITLPFARKGEIYDIDIFDAPTADTSLLAHRPPVSLPLGLLPRYDEPLIPWHFSAEGRLGSFSTAALRALADYKGKQWGIYGSTSYEGTAGHTDNSQGNSFRADIKAHSIVSTDNEVLGNMRASLGTMFSHEKYGMFGIGGESVDRYRNNFALDAHLATLSGQPNAVELDMKADVWSLGDSRSVADSQVSAVSPLISAVYGRDFESFKFKTGMSYAGSSLDYQHQVQSPSLLGLWASGEWPILKKWYLQLGGKYERGTGLEGEATSIAAPFAFLRWEIEPDRMISFWMQPLMQLASYGDETRLNPYLAPEVALRPEKSRVRLGASFWFNSPVFSLEIQGSFSKVSNQHITSAEGGRIWLDYVDATRYEVSAVGYLKPAEDMRLKFSGSISPSYGEGSSVQLPMVPIVQMEARGEADLHLPLTLWSSLSYMSRQNIDRQGARTLGDRLILGAGALSGIIPGTVLSFEISNIFNTAYEWWNGYKAPGRKFMLSARTNFL